ncbi:MAG: Crp/Fnr family transcriptional regulator [Ginsengibacter sp.]
MRRLFNYINQYASILIPEEGFEDFISHFVQKRVRKKQYLLQEGEICKHMAFIAKGAMRKYYLDESGIERIVDLYIEDWWAGDRESFVTSKPSVYNIDAWEDCELFLLSRDNALKLVDECPAFNEFVRKLDENNNIATQKRITSYISSISEKRYADFVDQHPYFIQRFPQHLIASYLGMTKDTLSRIRKKA